MRFFDFAAALCCISLPVVLGRTFTIQNLCSYPVYPGLFTSSGPAPALSEAAILAPSDSCSQMTWSIEDNWSGRIWPRTGCSNNGTCASGTCNGGLLCTGTGATPVSLAEWTLNAGGNVQDFYDISLVDGANVPLAITPSALACKQVSCSADLSADCPAALVQKDSSGATVGCKTACTANLDGTPANSPNCCSGQYDTLQTCPASGVAYYEFFKSQCPDAYAYAYDDANDSLHVCSAGLESDYTLSFCPTNTCSNGIVVPQGNGTIAIPSTTFSAGVVTSTGASSTRSPASSSAASSPSPSTTAKSDGSRTARTLSGALSLCAAIVHALLI